MGVPSELSTTFPLRRDSDAEPYRNESAIHKGRKERKRRQEGKVRPPAKASYHRTLVSAGRWSGAWRHSPDCRPHSRPPRLLREGTGTSLGRTPAPGPSSGPPERLATREELCVQVWGFSGRSRQAGTRGRRQAVREPAAPTGEAGPPSAAQPRGPLPLPRTWRQRFPDLPKSRGGVPGKREASPFPPRAPTPPGLGGRPSTRISLSSREPLGCQPSAGT